jgi:predicted RNA-binding Zn-ribbon protein involved in translation (DUF1610 family)
MSDEADQAQAIEAIERQAALARHAARHREPVPMCEACEEHPVHVTKSGTRWRFCPDCAEQHLRRNQAA